MINAEEKIYKASQKMQSAKKENRSMEALLFEACEKNDRVLCREILNSGVSATCKNSELFYSVDYSEYVPRDSIEYEDGRMYFECQRCEVSQRTPIIECAMHGHEDLVMEFIEWVDNHDMSFLSLTHEQCFKSFLYTSRNDDGDGLWHFAARHNMFRLAKKLKDEGISSDNRNGWGYTPLHFATPKMIPIVIECGCEKEGMGGDIGMTPLQDAVWHNDWKRFSALLKVGCSVKNITNGEELTDVKDKRIVDTIVQLRPDLF